MNSIDPKIVFDGKGVCNYCKQQEELMNRFITKEVASSESIHKMVKKFKKKSHYYDAIIGLSGGVDSAFSLVIASNLGLRVLAIHVDTGWNSEIAVSNIEKICNKLSVDLETVIVDWQAMKKIQKAFFYSGTLNLDIPQDHVILSAMYKTAYKIKLSTC
jgi:tRNA(Ile)-lysidine synthase TilS/MesJ